MTNAPVPSRRGRAFPHLAASAGLGLAASVGAWLLVITGVTGPVEAVLVDRLQRLRGERPVDPRVVLVEIDTESLDRYGRWPWPRTELAALVRALHAGGASVIAVDVVFSEPSRSGPGFDLRFEDEELAAAIEEGGRVVLSFFLREQPPRRPPATGTAGDPRDLANPANLDASRVDIVIEPPGGFPLRDYPAVTPSLDRFAAAAAAQGFTTAERQAGVARHLPLIARYRGEVYPSLPLRAVQRHLGGPLEVAADARGLPVIRLANGLVVTDGRGRLWLDYPGPGRLVPAVSVVDVLEGRVAPGLFEDRIVFVGASDPGLGDMSATPFGVEIPGVEIHAVVAENLLSGRYLRDGGTPRFISLAVLLLLGPAAALLVAGAERYWLGSLLAGSLILAWPATAYAALVGPGWHLELAAPLLAGGLALLAALRYQVGMVGARTREIRRVFGRYVSAEIVDEMLQHPDRVRLGGERKELTVLFADLRGFTSLSERLEPEVLTSLLNRILTPMTRRVLSEGGTLDKYIGDALMAIFGAPVTRDDHAVRACRAALGMIEELGVLNEGFHHDGLLPERAVVRLGIGISTGEMVVGNMGSDEVFDYTVLGDAVNLGSRLEGCTAVYGTPILATTRTAEAGAAEFLFREIDRVRVKGRQEAVSLWELMCRRPAPAVLEERVRRYRAALALYREQRFAAAAAAFEALAREGDPPAARLAMRASAFVDAPPGAEWEAVEVLSEK